MSIDESYKITKKQLQRVCEFRESLFSLMADNLSSRTIRQVQKAIGVWPLAHLTPVPNRDDIVILADMGTMTFAVDLGNYRLYFVFFQIGRQFRIGVKAPIDMVRKYELQNKISHAVDGTPCPRMDDIGNTFLFDWYYHFEDLTDPENQAWAIDEMLQRMMHIYMAVNNAVIAAGVLGENPPPTQAEAINILVNTSAIDGQEGIYDTAFHTVLSRIGQAGILIVQSYPQAPKRHLLMLGANDKALAEVLGLLQEIVERTEGIRAQVMPVEEEEIIIDQSGRVNLE